MKCPIDQRELAPRNYESGIVIDGCPECHGVWLQQGELERIQESVERDYSDELQAIRDTIATAYAMARDRQDAERHCPNCDAVLHRREYGYASQILIDACAKCRGVWLDRGELQALEVFFERSRQDTGKMRLGFFGSLLAQLRA